MIRFSNAADPGLQITCYAVGNYSEKAGVGESPIMRCFMSSGAGMSGMAVPIGRYHSQRGGLEINCDSTGLDNRTCNVGRTGVTPEMPGPINFVTDCATLMPDEVRCIGGDPILTRVTGITDARVSESAMLRDASGVPAGATSTGLLRPAAGATGSDPPTTERSGTMTCIRTLNTRPVPISIFASGPTSISATLVE
jgi:hypothetical protein